MIWLVLVGLLIPPFSFLRVTRLSDGEQFVMDGNMLDVFPNPSARSFIMTLLANQVYTIEIIPGLANPKYVPANIIVQMADTGACGEGITIRFLQEPNQPYQIAPSNYLDAK